MGLKNPLMLLFVLMFLQGTFAFDGLMFGDQQISKDQLLRIHEMDRAVQEGTRRAKGTKFQTQIVGGLDATPGQWPFMVLLYKNGVPICSGSLVAEDWVLTSAFCTHMTKNDYVQVLAGAVNQTMVDSTAQWRTVDWAINHPDWDAHRTVAALGLWHLSEPFTLNTYVKVAAIIDWDITYPGTTAVAVMGWGSRNKGNPWINLSAYDLLPKYGTANSAYLDDTPKTLQWSIMYLLADNIANQYYAKVFGLDWNYFNFLSPNTLYTGSDVDGTCDQLDDGSPITVKYWGPQGNRYASQQIAGVNVFRLTCTSSVDIHSKVWPYRSWITGAQYHAPIVSPLYLKAAVFPGTPGSYPATVRLQVTLPTDVVFDKLLIRLPVGFMVSNGTSLTVSGVLPAATGVSAMENSNSVSLMYAHPNVSIAAGDNSQHNMTLTMVTVASHCQFIAYEVELYLNNLRVAPGYPMVQGYGAIPDCVPQTSRTMQSLISAFAHNVTYDLKLRSALASFVNSTTRPAGSADITEANIGIVGRGLQKANSTFYKMQPGVLDTTCVGEVGMGTLTGSPTTQRCFDHCTIVLGDACTGFAQYSTAGAGHSDCKFYGLAANSPSSGFPAPAASATVTCYIKMQTLAWTVQDITTAVHGVSISYVEEWLSTMANVTDMESFLLDNGAGQAMAFAGDYPVIIESLEPVITVGTGVTTTLEDTPVVLPAVAVVHDSTSVSELLVSVNVIGGEVTLSTTAGLSIVSGNVTGIQTNFTMRGHKAYINAAMAAMTFTPALHFYGGAIISVTAQEVGDVFYAYGGLPISTTRLEIAVTGVNDAPNITYPYANIMLEDGMIQLEGISIEDVDSGTRPLNVSVIAQPGTFTLNDTSAVTLTVNDGYMKVFHGTLTGINAALKYILFKPSPDFFGTAYLNVHVDDMGGYPSPAQVSVLPIPITVRPQQDNIHLGASPESVTTAEDVALLLPLPLLTDADPVAKVTVNMTLLNGTLTFTSTTGVTVYTLAPKTYMLQGSLTDVNTQLGQTYYTGDQDWYGMDRLDISVSDEGNVGYFQSSTTDMRNMSITVTPVNDAPVVTFTNPLYYVNRWYNASVPASVSDVDLFDGEIRVTASCQKCKLTIGLPENTTISIIGNTGYELVDNSLTFQGPLQAINVALATLEFQTTEQFHPFITHIEGSFFTNDKVTIAANDLGASGAGGAQVGTGSANVTVTAELYPTCQSFLDQRSFDYCGCYYIVPGTNTSYPWLQLPTEFPSPKFYEMTTPNRYLQGCCKHVPPTLVDGMLTETGRLTPCKNTIDYTS